MSFSSVESFLNFPLFCFRLVNIYPLSVEDPGVSKKQRIMKVLSSVWFWIILLNMAYCYFGIVMLMTLERSYLIDVAINLPSAFVLLIGVYKALIVKWNTKGFCEILDALKKLFPTKTEDQKKYKVEKYLRSFKKFKLSYVLATLCLFASYSLAPIFQLLMGGKKSLPMEIWFPFDAYSAIAYPLAYLWFNWIALSLNCIMLGTDILLYTLLILISMQFDIVKQDLKEAIAEGSSLNSIVNRHNQLLQLCKKLENIFSAFFLYNFLQSSFLICFIGFELSTTTDFSAFMKFVSYLEAVLIQILLLYHPGQILINSSLGITEGVSDSLWYTKSPKKRKDLLLVIMQAQRESHLTAKKFSVISLKSFTSVSRILN